MSQFLSAIYKEAIKHKSLKKAMRFIDRSIGAAEREGFLKDFLFDWLEFYEFKPKTRYSSVHKQLYEVYRSNTQMPEKEIEDMLSIAMLNHLIRKIKDRDSYDQAWLKSQFDQINEFTTLESELLFDHYYDLILDTDIHQNAFFHNKGSYRVSKQKMNIINPAKTWDSTADYYKPHDLQGVVDCVNIAINQKKEARGIGIRFSFSGVVQTDKVYIDTVDCYDYDMSSYKRHLDSVKKLPQDALRNTKMFDENLDFEAQLVKHPYIEIPASMKVKEINNILYPDYKKAKINDAFRFGKQRIYNMGGADLQTFVGAFSTGTHGSGGIKSSLQDMVRSVLLVAVKQTNNGAKAQVYRVEPSDGITDPVKHAASMAQQPDAIREELIQDDDTFNATIVSMGYFGIIYSVIAETLPMKSFHEEVIPRHAKDGGWQHFKTELSGQQFKQKLLQEDWYINLLLNPYSTYGNMDINSFNYREIKQLATLQSPKDVKGKEKRRRIIPKIFLKLFKTKALSSFSNSKNSKANSIETTLKSMLDNQDKKMGYTDIFYKAVPAGTAHFKSTGLAVEFAFKFEDYAQVLTDLIEKINQSAEFTNAPIAIRFMKPSKALLAFNYELDGDGNPVDIWVAIEVLRIRDVRIKASDNFKFLKEIQQFLLDKGGRPHWGLNFELENDITKAEIHQMYPKFNEWLAAYNHFNPSLDGNRFRVFNNKFSKVFDA